MRVTHIEWEVDEDLEALKRLPKEYYNDYEKDEKNINVDKDENDFDYE